MRLARRLIAVTMAPALVAGATTGCARIAGRAKPFRDLTTYGRSSIRDKVPSIALASVATIEATAPFTVLDVQPLQVKGSAKLVAVRAFFFGWGTTPGGYRAAQGLPSPVCARPPITGYGETYPVQNLRLQPGDQPHFVYYLYADQPGESSASGYRITYRRGDGNTTTHTGDLGELTMNVFPVRDGIRCAGAEGRILVQPEPGYPSAVSTPVP